MGCETSPLLQLPLELRELIYKEVLLQHSAGPQLLWTCREVHSEAHKFLFQRPIFFRSQSALHRWLQTVPVGFLQHVNEVALELQDVNLTHLLTPVSPTLPEPSKPSPPLHTWDLYEREFGHIRTALERLPNIKTFTLKTLSGRQSHLFHDLLEQVLNMLGPTLPCLEDLRLEGNYHNQNLTFLLSIKDLKKFSFDGFSASGVQETAEILSALKLTKISLVSHHALLTPTLHQHSNFTFRSQCFDGNVLSKLKNLASFSVTEHIPATSPTLFFTSEILGSLHSHKTLSNLAINLSYTPDLGTLDALGDFLRRTSSIEKLELDWPNLDPSILESYEMLPCSLKSLWIRVGCIESAFDVLWHLLEQREEEALPALTSVVLVRSPQNTASSDNEAHDLPTFDSAYTDQVDRIVVGQNDDPYPNDSDEDNVARAKRRLNELSVRVAWFTED